MVDDRGQLLLIGAITVAVAILGTVVLLNDLQYVDAAGASAETGAIDEAERTEAMVERDLTGLIDAVWASNPSDPSTALEENVTVYSNYSRNMTASRGYTMNTSLNTTASTGNHIRYDTSAASPPNFRADGGPNPNEWDVVTDATTIRRFTMEIDPRDAGQDFDVLVNPTGGAEWELHVVEDGTSDIDLVVQNDTVTRSCDIGDPSVEFDLLAGGMIVPGCTVPGIDESASAPYTVRFDDANHAEGSYELVVSNGAQQSDVRDPNNDDDYDAPVHAAIDYRYRSPDVSYNRTIVVEPEGSS